MTDKTGGGEQNVEGVFVVREGSNLEIHKTINHNYDQNLPHGKSDEEIKSLIEAEVPGIKDAVLSDIQQDVAELLSHQESESRRLFSEQADTDVEKEGGEAVSYEDSAAVSLSDSTIRRQVLADAVRHPATMLPLATSAASGIYMLVLSPVLGGGLWGIVLLAASGAMAAGAFGWLYIVHCPREYAERARERELVRLEQEATQVELNVRMLARSEWEEVKQLRTALQSGFSRIDSDAGSRALGGLAGEYDRLLPALGRRAEADPLLMPIVSGLAADAYRSGIDVLADALELMKVTGPESRERWSRLSEQRCPV